VSVTDPPVAKRWHTREDSGIRLDREGRWWHDDEPVEHPRIVEAFNTSLQATDDGRFKLVFGWDWCFVQVEGAPYRVLGVHQAEGPSLVLALSDRTSEPLDPATLELDADGVLQCRVKGSRAQARFGRDAQFQLGSLLQAKGEGAVLRLGDRDWPVPLSPR
jgi:hypothetical protein